MAGNAINRTSSAPMKTILPPQELLDDLCSRFVLNVPQEDLESFERIFFLLEQAHWFYEDNSVEQNPALKSLSFKEFTSLIIQLINLYILFLKKKDVECLLVKGWKIGASWSFPRGKKSKDEEDHTCAYREVLEETGFNISDLLNLDDYIEVVIGEQRVRLYIIAGVKEDTAFAPLTKKEISEISWHRLDEILPASEEVFSRGTNGLKLYMVAPFVTALKAWIAAHPPPPGQKAEASAKGMCVWKVKSSNLGGGGSTADSNQMQKAASDAQDAADVRPGRSFRNFRFDVPSILQSMEAVFSAK